MAEGIVSDDPVTETLDFAADRRENPGMNVRLLAVPIVIVLLLLPLTACGSDDPTDNASVDGMCRYYGRMLDAEFERQAILDFMGAAIGYSERNNAPGLTRDVEEFAKALDNGDTSEQQAFHERMALHCESYWDTHGLPKGIESKSLGDLSEEAERKSLENAIGATLDELIDGQDIPYTVTQGPEFQMSSTAVEGTGIPAGTALVVQFDDYLSLPFSEETAAEVTTLRPLELYAEALRPHVDDMDFVVLFILSWRTATEDAFLIYPEQMRLYLDGDITTKELAQKMLIYGF